MHIEERVSMAQHSSFRLGGAARYAVSCLTEQDVRLAFQWAHKKNIPWRALGSGSNTLVGDNGFNGLVIWFRRAEIIIDEEAHTVTADAGAITAVVAGSASRAGLTGFEWAAGVPGTMGGAVCGNAGASGREIKDSVLAVRAMDTQGSTHDISPDQCEFGYRHSRFKRGDLCILSVTIQLSVAPSLAVSQAKIRETLQYRTDTQPKGVATCGCAFKNYECRDDEILALQAHQVPEHFLARRRIPAGWLIEHAGLKNYQQGGARVSEMHGNFIISDATATAADILAVMAHIKKTVLAQFGVALTEEIAVLQ